MSRISSIVELSLQGAQFSPGFIDSLNHMKGIDILHYEACAQPASALLRYKYLKRLHFLDITRSEGVSELLKRYPAGNDLQELNASYDHLSDSDLLYISRLTKLTKLKISGNSGITTKGILQLASLPLLRTLEILDMKTDPSLPGRVKSWQSLKTLLLESADWSEQETSR